MLNLYVLNCSEINEYDKISGSKREPRKSNLTTLRQRVLADYTSYSNDFNTIHTRSASTYTNGSEKEDLLHCYNGSTIALESLIRRIEENQKTELRHICAYCLYNKIEETDHYIPKEEYAEFCILSSNLIPICSVCNKTKNQNWRNDTLTRRTFIHLYKDNLPNTQFLFATLNYINNLPQFTWIVNNGDASIAASLFSIIEDHFDKLHLAERYRKACNELLAEISLTVRAQRRLNPDIKNAQISNLLNAESLEEEVSFGPNYWKSIAKKILANDRQYINSL